jgi:hypothetical protein
MNTLLIITFTENSYEYPNPVHLVVVKGNFTLDSYNELQKRFSQWLDEQDYIYPQDSTPVVQEIMDTMAYESGFAWEFVGGSVPTCNCYRFIDV